MWFLSAFVRQKTTPIELFLEVRAGKSGSLSVFFLAAESGFLIEKGPCEAGTRQRVFRRNFDVP